jgi:hypothetical protein
MTLARYFAAVAVVYFATFLALALILGWLAEGPADLRLWSLPFLGASFGVFCTWVTMERFGDIGGSVYFFPTVIHVFVFIVLAFAMFRV